MEWLQRLAALEQAMGEWDDGAQPVEAQDARAMAEAWVREQAPEATRRAIVRAAAIGGKHD
jgi:alpha/beta superfamily hydrolase